MTALTIRQLLADVLERADPDGEISCEEMADALASPLADIIDMASRLAVYIDAAPLNNHAEVRALLADWRANRLSEHNWWCPVCNRPILPIARHYLDHRGFYVERKWRASRAEIRTVAPGRNLPRPTP